MDNAAYATMESPPVAASIRSAPGSSGPASGESTESTSSSFNAAWSAATAFVCRPFRSSSERVTEEDNFAASSSDLPTATTTTNMRRRSPSVRVPRDAPAAIRRSSRTASSAARRETEQALALRMAATTPARSTAARKRHASAASSGGSRKKQRSTGNLKQPPANLKNDADYEDSKPAAAKLDGAGSDCCICLTQPESHQRSTLDGCDHQFCFDCIVQWADRENSCPLCKERFTKINRCQPLPRAGRGEKKSANMKTVKNRDQQADMAFAGSALQGLLASISARNGGARGFHVEHGFGGRLVFESRAMYALGGGPRRQLMVGNEDSEEEDDDSYMFYREINSPPGTATNGTVGAAAPAFRDPRAPSHSMVHVRSTTRTRVVPVAANATARRREVARMSIPSMVQVRGAAPAAAAASRNEMGSSALRPFEVEDDSDDEIEVMGVLRPT